PFVVHPVLRTEPALRARASPPLRPSATRMHPNPPRRAGSPSAPVTGASALPARHLASASMRRSGEWPREAAPAPDRRKAPASSMHQDVHPDLPQSARRESHAMMQNHHPTRAGALIREPLVRPPESEPVLQSPGVGGPTQAGCAAVGQMFEAQVVRTPEAI